MLKTQSRAAVLRELNRPLELWDLDLPPLKPGQVLVGVAYSGLCRSQLLEARGHRGEDRFLPHTLGHEGSGVVLEVGEGVKKVKVGDPVVISWIRGSGVDVPATTYRHRGDIVNSGAVSTFMRRTVTCENRVTPVSGDMPLRAAALLGCAIPTGAGIVSNTAKVFPGASLAVFGMGGVGLSAVLAAAIEGATPLIAVDVVDSKLEQALALGATHALNARREDPLKAIRALTGGRGADFAIEAAGRRETMEMAIAAVRDAGGLCVLAGNLPAGERISMDPFDLIRGKRVVGTWGGETDPDRDIPRYEAMFLQGKLKIDQLITQTYPLEQVNEALADLEDGKTGRALIEMGP